MRNLPARHFLAIYQLRKRMAEDGVTSPPREIVEQVSCLITGLSGVDPDTPVGLEHEGEKVRFIAVETGEVLGELDRKRKG